MTGEPRCSAAAGLPVVRCSRGGRYVLRTTAAGRRLPVCLQHARLGTRRGLYLFVDGTTARRYAADEIVWEDPR